MTAYFRRSRKLFLYALGLIFACLAFYLLSYGPMWNLAAKGTLSWTSFEAIYRPIPSNIRSRVFAAWRRVDPRETPGTSLLGSELHREQENLDQARRRTEGLAESFGRMGGDENAQGFEAHRKSRQESDAQEAVTDILRRRVTQEANSNPPFHK